MEGLTLWGGLERVKGGMVLAPSARKVWKEASRQLTITRLSPATTPKNRVTVAAIYLRRPTL
jgi:hypothetical protein